MNFFAKNKEENLSRRLRNGDSHAMREFYALYGTYLTAVCLRYVPDEEDMRDIIQDSMIQIITHISAFTYRGEGSLRAWATKIVVSQSLRFLQRRNSMNGWCMMWNCLTYKRRKTLRLTGFPLM